MAVYFFVRGIAIGRATEKDTQIPTMLAQANAASTAQTGAKTSTDKPAATTGNTNDAAAQVDELKTEQTLLKQMAEAIKRTRRPVVDMINECLRPLAPPLSGIAGDSDIREGDIIPDTPPFLSLRGNTHRPGRST